MEVKLKRHFIHQQPPKIQSHFYLLHALQGKILSDTFHKYKQIFFHITLEEKSKSKNMPPLSCTCTKSGALHSGLVLRIKRDLDSVLLYVVKVRGSSGWIETVCNQSNMENGS